MKYGDMPQVMLRKKAIEKMLLQVRQNQRHRRLKFWKECATAGALFVTMVALLGLAEFINR